MQYSLKGIQERKWQELLDIVRNKRNVENKNEKCVMKLVTTLRLRRWE